MRRALAGLAISGAALLVACGGSSEKPTSTTTAATTAPAATATRPAATSTVASATATTVPATEAAAPSPTPPAAPPPANTEIPPPPPPPPPPTEPAPASGVTLTIVALNDLFDTRSLTAAAGPVAIIFDNQDTTDTHNIHFFSKTGSIGMTEIMAGPATETLSLGTLAPGSYPYKCDVHPQTMTGVLTVS